jgi:hypothetical protein
VRNLLSAFIASLVLVACDAAPSQPQPDLGAAVDMAQPAGPMCGLPMPPPASCQGQADGEPCDDGDACTASDICNGGVCAGDMQRICVRCAADADCCAGVGSVVCDSDSAMWAPTGRCLPGGVCAMERFACRFGATCEPGKDCR